MTDAQHLELDRRRREYLELCDRVAKFQASTGWEELGRRGMQQASEWVRSIGRYAELERFEGDPRELLDMRYNFFEAEKIVRGESTARGIGETVDPELERKAQIYDELKALGLLEQMGIEE